MVLACGGLPFPSSNVPFFRKSTSFATPPLLIVYIPLDTLGHPGTKSRQFFTLPGPKCPAGGSLFCHRRLSLERSRDDAISARLDRAVPECRMPRAWPLAPRRKLNPGILQQLRSASPKCSPAPRPALPHASSPARQLSPHGAPLAAIALSVTIIERPFASLRLSGS